MNHRAGWKALNVNAQTVEMCCALGHGKEMEMMGITETRESRASTFNRKPRGGVVRSSSESPCAVLTTAGPADQPYPLASFCTDLNYTNRAMS